MTLLHMVLLGIGMLLSLAAAGYVKYQFARGQEVRLRSRMTGAEVARRILSDQDITDVEVHEHQGFLSDHYNPGNKTLNLSPDVYNGRSAAAAGVAAHEVGHAVQHARGDVTMWARSILVYPAHFGGMLAPFLVIGGLALGSAHQIAAGKPGFAAGLAYAGVGLFAVALLCSLFIVWNEFDASSKAKTSLVRLGITNGEEEDSSVRAVLFAAGLTYVASAVIAAMELAYWAAQAGLFGGNRQS